MASEILNKPLVTEGISLVDAMFIAGAKVGTEELFSRVAMVGNGTMRSALIKGVVAVGLAFASNNKYVRYVSAGVAIDAVEDAILAIRRGNFSLAGNTQQASAEVVY